MPTGSNPRQVAKNLRAGGLAREIALVPRKRDHDLPKKIGRRIAFYRGQAAMSQTDLAARIGSTKMVISKIERGVTLPSIPRLLEIATALGQRPSRLLETDYSHSPLARLSRRIWALIDNRRPEEVEAAIKMLRMYFEGRPVGGGDDGN